ncbi:MAG TPA: arylamine N-acetyltransferase, partial [Thermoanaerobaculia bacterium]|nr:arylamine N-acetyltransferase [Thermoanaerobaculia bacterium]
NSPMPDALRPDLDRYFARLGDAGERMPTLATLARLQAAHLDAIPFENLDVRLGRPIALDLASLEAKLVGRRRGGYCFEQNTLFAAVLRALGFELDTLEARVLPPGATSTLPRTHMTLRVRLAEGDHLADVGFGGDGPLAPVPFDGTPVAAGGETHRLARETGGIQVLQRRVEGVWTDLYAFSPTPALPIDYEVANHFTSTHPRSIFRQTLTAQRATVAGRHLLRGRTYTLRRGDASESRELYDAGALELLRGTIGLDVTGEEVRAALAEEGPGPTRT